MIAGWLLWRRRKRGKAGSGRTLPLHKRLRAALRPSSVIDPDHRVVDLLQTESHMESSRSRRSAQVDWPGRKSHRQVLALILLAGTTDWQPFCSHTFPGSYSRKCTSSIYTSTWPIVFDNIWRQARPGPICRFQLSSAERASCRPRPAVNVDGRRRWHVDGRLY